MSKITLLKSGASFLWKVPNRKINSETLRYIPKSKPDEFVSASKLKTNEPDLVNIYDILSRSNVKPKIIKSLYTDFSSKKSNLINNLQDVLEKSTLESLKLAKTPEELATIIERYQVNLLNKVGKSKDILYKSTDTNKESLIENYMRDYYRFTDTIYQIQKGMADKTTNPEVLKIEKVLQEKYGFNFVALGDNLKQAKNILNACKIWTKAGEKIPNDIILTETMPVAFAQGQCLHTSNGNTCILIAKNPNLMSRLGTYIEKFHDTIVNLFNSSKTHLKSTNSKYHTYIHEFSHSVQSKSIIENRLSIPNGLKPVAEKVSEYGKCSLEELYAELKAKSILTPKKMKEQEWKLLQYLEQ